MSKLKNAVGAGLGVALCFTVLFGLKWYNVAAKNPIDPQRGIYAMQDLEIFIDINTHLMPDFAREWACRKLIAREQVAMGGRNTFPPHGCQSDYKEQMARPRMTMVDTVIAANTSQIERLHPDATPAQMAAFATCLTDGLNAAVPTDAQVKADDGDIPAMKAISIGASKAAHTCRAALQ